MLPTISRKTRWTRRFLIPSKLCAPRKSATKSDSHVRGESGGTLISSDLPARPGNTPLDTTAWLSTRVCEALVSISSELTVRVIGVYGFSTRYPHHTQATNNLLSRLLGMVAQSFPGISTANWKTFHGGRFLYPKVGHVRPAFKVNEMVNLSNLPGTHCLISTTSWYPPDAPLFHKVPK